MKKSNCHLITILLVLVILAISVSGAFAFDQQRKGFIFGMGLGPGFASYTKSTDFKQGDSTVSEDQSKAGLFTDLKIGYAPSNQLMIYWMSKVAWTGRTDTLLIDTTSRSEDITVATGVGGVGITYFFKPKSPSLFVSLGVGLSGWAYPFEDRDFWTGLGVAGGVGWEFRPSWFLEASVLWGKPEFDDIDYKYSADILAFGITINVVGY